MSTNTPRLGLLKPDPIEAMSDVDSWLNGNMDKLDAAAGIPILSDTVFLPVSPYVGQTFFIAMTDLTPELRGVIVTWTGTEWRHRGKKAAGFERRATNYAVPVGSTDISYTTTNNVGFTQTSATIMTCLVAGLYMITWESKWSDVDRNASFELSSGAFVNRGGTDIFVSFDGHGLQPNFSAGLVPAGGCGMMVCPLAVGDTVRGRNFNGYSSPLTMNRSYLAVQCIGTETTYTTPV